MKTLFRSDQAIIEIIAMTIVINFILSYVNE